MKAKATLLSSVCLSLLAGTAVSQEAGAVFTGIDEIVVTAQKRSESLQTVPIAVSAFGAEQLANRSITNIEGLTGSIPNFRVNNYNGNTQISVRGLSFDSINPGAEARVAAHVDGIYISRPAAVGGAFFDMERVEVLRGPQGTLYGRNATAGSVNFITRDPTDEFSGYIRQTVGNYNDFISEGAISGPLGSGFSARLAGRAQSRSGYGENIITGTDIDDVNSRSLRGKLLFDPNTRFSLLLSADYHHEDDRNHVIKFIERARPDLGEIGHFAMGGMVAPNPRDVAYHRDPTNNRTFWGLSATATLDLDELVVKSISSYRNSKYAITGSFSGLSDENRDFSPYDQFEKSETFSQELQLSQESEKFNWIAGAYYFHESGDTATFFPIYSDEFGFPGPVQVLQGYFAGGSFKTDTAAIFGQLTYRITPDLSLTVGERFGYEKKTKSDTSAFELTRAFDPDNFVLAPYMRANTDDYYHSPKVNISYQITPDALAYATYALGYKSGGFDIGGYGAAYRPEKLTDYEVGLKAQWLDNRLRTNISAFYYDYKDIQASVVKEFIIAIENAASAELYGLEIEVIALPFDGLELGFSGGYLDSKYKNFQSLDSVRPHLGVLDLSGNQLAQAAKWNTNVSAQYSWQAFDVAEVSIRGNWRYKSKVYFSPFNVDYESAAGNHIFDLALNITDNSGRWTGSIFGRNITGKRVTAYNFVTVEHMGYNAIGTYEPPATYGVSIGYNF